MDSELDLYDDILPEPIISNACAGGRFQPKAKPCLKKKSSAAVPSALVNDKKENPVIVAPSGSKTTQSVQPVDVGVADDRLTDTVSLTTLSSNLLENKDPLKNIEDSFPHFPLSDDPRNLECENPTSQLLGTGEDVGATNVLPLEVPLSDNNVNWCSSSGKSAGKADSFGYDMDPFDDILLECATSNVRACGKFQPMARKNVTASVPSVPPHHFDTHGEGPLGPSETSTLHASNTEREPDVPVLSSIESSAFRGCISSHSFPELLVTRDSVTCTEADMSNNDRVFLINNGGLEAEFQQVGHFETEYTNQGSIPSFPSDDVPDFPANKYTTSPVESLPSDAANYRDVVHSEAASGMPGKVIDNNMKRNTPMPSDLSQKSRTSLAAGEGIEAGEPSRRLRKRVAYPNLNGPEDENYDGGFPAESPSNVDDDNNDDEYSVHNTSLKKRVTRKSRKADPGNEKPVQKRKKANEVPDMSTKEPPKKFSHSTRRNRRRVDKVLLETPEYEIDMQKVPIKQLILLAEIRERTSIKEASNSKIPSTSHSAENSSARVASYNEGEASDSEHDRDFNDDQTGSPVQLNTGYFNYHSFMDRTPSTRWTKQDTELFYETIQQFGTDFSMVQQLFPGRTRNQIKLKFKKEERQHPLRLSEAVQNRAKNHSHFERVIRKLHQAVQTQAEEDLSRDEIGVPGEEDEVEDAALETNEEAAKSEQKEQDENKDKMEAVGAEVHSPENFDESDDVIQRWNQYRSSFG